MAAGVRRPGVAEDEQLAAEAFDGGQEDFRHHHPLGAQAMRAGHQVKVLNLSAFPWSQVEKAIAALDADLYGMSCWTANRRGVALVADAIRAHHPGAHIVIGGPHATPLASPSSWNPLPK